MSERRAPIAGKGKSKGPVPRFESLEEESSFWDTHSFLDQGDWEAVPYHEVCRDLASQNGPKISVTFRLEKQLVGALKEAARCHGIKYQVLVREILRRSLSGAIAAPHPRKRTKAG
jgi:predicted DNA binding CopG/RHH family protein